MNRRIFIVMVIFKLGTLTNSILVMLQSWTGRIAMPLTEHITWQEVSLGDLHMLLGVVAKVQVIVRYA